MKDTHNKYNTDLISSLFGVWYRHYKVYTSSFIANATPPVLEPLFFFAAFALGMSGYLSASVFDGLDYRTYVASGMLVSSAMYTAVFETTFGTFVRLVYQKTYDAMLGTHLTINEIFTGEMLFSASKGALYSSVVVLVTMVFGVKVTPWCLMIPIIGFLTGYLFAAIGLVVTSFVNNMSNFSFFTTGIITPLFFFSGTFFPIKGIHPVVDLIADLLPLVHPIELGRMLFRAELGDRFWIHLAGLMIYLVSFHLYALARMRRRILGPTPRG